MRLAEAKLWEIKNTQIEALAIFSHEILAYWQLLNVNTPRAE